jgi:hypothetical protein
VSFAAWFRLLLIAVLAVLAVEATCRAEPPAGKKYALLVGVREYNSKHFPSLRFTENDVEGLAQVLGRPGSGFAKVRVLTTSRGQKNANDAPTAANVRKELDRLLAGKGKQDLVLVALSGHGIQLDVKDPDGDRPPKTFAYFCPSDASLSDVRYTTGFSKHLIHLNDTFEAIGRCDAGTKLVLMDACRNELEVKAASRNVDLKKVTIPDGVGALFSCKSGQRAFETEKLKHGVFFHFVLLGLRGRARTSDNEVTWDSLAGYVRKQVARQVPGLVGGGARQDPQMIANLAGESPVLVKGPAGEKFLLRVKDHPDMGRLMRLRQKQAQIARTRTTDEGGKLLSDDRKTRTSEQVLALKVLEGGQRPARLQMTFEKSSTNDGKKSVALPFEGQTVYLRLHGDRYEASTQNNTLSKDDLARLAAQHSASLAARTANLLPAKPVAVGQARAIGSKNMAPLFAVLGLNPQQARGTGKLLRVFKKGNQQWGVLRFHFQFTVPMKNDAEAMRGDLFLTLELAIDGSSAEYRGLAKSRFVRKQSVQEMGRTVQREVTLEGLLATTRVEVR